MSSFTKVKEFFGMAPVGEIDGEYLDEYDAPVGGREDRYESDRYVRPRADDDFRDAARADRRSEYGYHPEYADEAPRQRRYAAAAAPSPRAAHADDAHDLDSARRPQRYLSGRAAATRGAVALAPEADDYSDGLVTSTETVVERPRGFADGKNLGESFRLGKAVVLDVSSMGQADARRMVDFAAGLVFALDGRIKKVADRERTFLLEPAGMDLTDAEVREAVTDAFRR